MALSKSIIDVHCLKTPYIRVYNQFWVNTVSSRQQQNISLESNQLSAWNAGRKEHNLR